MTATRHIPLSLTKARRSYIDSEDLAGGRIRTPLLLAAAAVVIALVSASQLYFNWVAAGYQASFRELAGSKLLEWGLWTAFVPVIVRIERTRGFTARPPGLAATVHLLSALAFFAVLNGALSGLTLIVDPAAAGASFGRTYLQRAGAKLASAMVVYAAILCGYWLLRLREERHREAALSARLRADLSDARLLNLKSQIHPHFLFNALHTVAGLVQEGDPETAVETIAELGDLLRRALRDYDQQEVPLREEMEFLQRYVRIQELRFGDRLEVTLEADLGAADAAVPSLLLQPIVENAIRHGLDLDGGHGGRVVVTARGNGRELVLEVTDNGRGIGEGPVREGLGLGTTRRRLQQLYGPAASLRVRPARGGGVSVVIRLPLRARSPDPLPRGWDA